MKTKLTLATILISLITGCNSAESEINECLKMSEGKFSDSLNGLIQEDSFAKECLFNKKIENVKDDKLKEFETKVYECAKPEYTIDLYLLKHKDKLTKEEADEALSNRYSPLAGVFGITNAVNEKLEETVYSFNRKDTDKYADLTKKERYELFLKEDRIRYYECINK